MPHIFGNDTPSGVTPDTPLTYTDAHALLEQRGPRAEARREGGRRSARASRRSRPTITW